MVPERDPAAKQQRTIIVGDVHGCLDEMERLFRLCAVDWSGDRVILVGDLVAKGPDSQGVVQLARERNIAAVLGNHDAKVLTFSPGSEAAGLPAGKAKHHAQVAYTMGPADWAYLQALPLTRALPDLDTVVVHAGLVAGVPLDQQPRDMAINMRSITPDGQPSKRIEAGVPWASAWTGPAHVVFGHDAVRGLQLHKFATGLDTGCVYGRALTALILPENNLMSVRARRSYVDL
jgi:Calcineurin-like phosphoesterase